MIKLMKRTINFGLLCRKVFPYLWVHTSGVGIVFFVQSVHSAYYGDDLNRAILQAVDEVNKKHGIKHI